MKKLSAPVVFLLLATAGHARAQSSPGTNTTISAGAASSTMLKTESTLKHTKKMEKELKHDTHRQTRLMEHRQSRIAGQNKSRIKAADKATK